MKYKEDRRKIFDAKSKLIIVVSLLLSFMILMLSVWQSGLSRTNHYELLSAQKKLNDLDNEERNLVAFISEMENTQKATVVYKAGI